MADKKISQKLHKVLTDFQNFFHGYTQQQICNKMIIKYTTLVNFQFYYSKDDNNISQPNAATLLSCRGIFNSDFIANLLLSVSLKEF